MSSIVFRSFSAVIVARTMLIGRTASDALGEDIADAGQFQHRADRTAGDNTGTFSCRTQEYFACTVCSSDLMRDRRTDYRYSEQVFLGIFLSFADRVRNFVCLSGSEAYTAFFVTDYHKSGEAEATSTFNYFCYTVDCNDACLEFLFTITVSSWSTFHSHNLP